MSIKVNAAETPEASLQNIQRDVKDAYERWLEKRGMPRHHLGTKRHKFNYGRKTK